jgi:hypothetical protein
MKPSWAIALVSRIPGMVTPLSLLAFSACESASVYIMEVSLEIWNR